MCSRRYINVENSIWPARKIISKIKAMQPVNPNELDTLTTFAVKVKGLRATIEASGLRSELENSSLLQEIIEKVPPTLQLNWGTFKLSLLKEHKFPNLTTFSDWIFEYGISASSVNIHQNMQTSDSKNKKHMFTHVEQQRKCYVCKQNCNNVAKCQKFIGMDRAMRWNIVRQYNLCKQCLGQHVDKTKCQKVAKSMAVRTNITLCYIVSLRVCEMRSDNKNSQQCMQ